MADVATPQANPIGQVAHHLPVGDAAPVIAAHEQNLVDYLNLPVRDVLSRLGLAPARPDAPRPDIPADNTSSHDSGTPDQPGPAPQSAPGTGGFDPMSLIQPVTDALGTLGSGNFGNADPTQMFTGISKAFDSSAGPLQQALAGLQDGWTGHASTAAASKTTAAVQDGSRVGEQSMEVRRSVANAAAQVHQGQIHLLTIIGDFQATIAAIGPNIIFPWGWVAAISAATKAISMGATVVTQLQGALATEAAAVTTAGAPVLVAEAPQVLSALAPVAQLAAGGISSGTGAISSGVQSAGKAAQDHQPTDPSQNPLGENGSPSDSMPGGAAAALGPGGIAGGFGGGPAVTALTSRPVVAFASPPAETAATVVPAQTGGARTVAASTGVGMGGAGMMGAGSPAAGKASVSGHQAASFLHTSDQGDEIVGDLGTAAPPVIGEVEFNDTPDIELRI
ncbi:hypothetical protein [Mycolicibacterium sp. CBMA 226]|uniref:hypothetical protein n=1 Tax=Mycolicibacterium sp. CBMA 226 TaxID=2606611 RepID=UPI0012DD570B|nr:hypothetical protein [Mycolicibacterium sp. CBMA 226]MUL78880.1 hypothetical protein [Mycolicibacterium sp. CBMA 226]QGW61179.1 hypothetical protein ICEMyc226_00147 [Mycolicibacterium sp.]